MSTLDFERIFKNQVIINIDGMEKNSEEVIFTFMDGRKFRMYPDIEYRANAYLADVVGDTHDLLHHPLLAAEEVTNVDYPPIDDEDGDYKWTFYKLATINGYVDLRWFGSDGRYSHEVSIEEIK